MPQDYTSIAETRKEAKLYLQARKIREIRVEYKKHWKDFKNYSQIGSMKTVTESEKTENRQIPGKIKNIVQEILAQNFPGHEEGSQGYIEWNLENDTLKVHHEEHEQKETIHCEKFYKRDDPEIQNIVALEQYIWPEFQPNVDEIKKWIEITATPSIKNKEIHYKIQYYASNKSVIQHAIESPSFGEQDEDLARKIKIAGTTLYQLATNEPIRISRPLPSEIKLQQATAEIGIEGDILIASENITIGKNIFIHDFLITEEGRKSEYNIFQSNRKGGERTKKQRKTTEPSKIAWLIPIIATALILIPITAPWIHSDYFGKQLSMASLFPIVATAVAAWIRFLARRKLWKRALEKQIWRTAGLSENSRNKLEKETWKRAHIHIHDYFNYLQTFEERRRSNVMAIEEASRKDKEHDHVAITMRKQEDANAVAFLKKYYAKYESK